MNNLISYSNGNFNEIEAGTPPRREGGDCERTPNKLSNNFLKMDRTKKSGILEFRYDKAVETIYIEKPIKVSPQSFMKGLR